MPIFPQDLNSYDNITSIFPPAPVSTSVADELIDVGAIGDTLLALEHSRSMMLLEQSFNDYSFVSMADPINEIESRNMQGSQAPIPYPYRDDGLLV